MGFLDTLSDVIDGIKIDREENEGLLDELKETLKKTDIGSTIDDFKRKGLGGTISSWISNDENKSITVDEVKNLFGENKMSEFSGKSGFSLDEAGESSSKILPEIFDRSTPNGKVED